MNTQVQMQEESRRKYTKKEKIALSNIILNLPMPPKEENYVTVRMRQMNAISRSTLSPDFLAWIFYKAYEMQKAHMEKRKDKRGLKLLEIMTCLSTNFMEMNMDGNLSGIVDENIVGLVGELTYLLNFREYD